MTGRGQGRRSRRRTAQSGAGESGCRAWCLLEVLARRHTPAAGRIGGVVVVRDGVTRPPGVRAVGGEDRLTALVEHVDLADVPADVDDDRRDLAGLRVRVVEIDRL